MKLKVIFVAFAVCLITGYLTCAKVHADTAPAPRKLALLVGIDNYQADIPNLHRDTETYAKLHGSLDSHNLQQVLISNRYNFAPADVRVLSDKESTHKGIVTAFRQQLIAQARPGDIVVFMYSGHGDQVKDDNGDETDGLDEVFVPYDWNNNDDNSFLRDDEIQQLLADLAKKMTVNGKMKGNITMIVDSCHSGTIARGRLIAKGRGRGEMARNASKGNSQSRHTGSGYDADSIKNYVLISACQSDQSAYETSGPDGKSRGGALVYNLCKILTEDNINPGMTYKELIDRTRIQVKADPDSQQQTPVAEGQINWKLFDGQIKPTLSLVRVTNFDDSRKQVTLNTGILLGVAKGTKYTLYPPNADPEAPGSPLGEITVKSVTPANATADIVPAKGITLTKDMLLGAPAVLAELPENRRLKVLLDGTSDIASLLEDKSLSPQADPLDFVAAPAGTAAKIKGAAKGEKTAAVPQGIPHEASNYDYYIQRVNTGKGAAGDLILRRADDSQVARVTGDKVVDLRKTLIREWRWQTLAGVNTDDSNSAAGVQLKIIPIAVGDKDEEGKIRSYKDLKPVVRADGQLELHEGDAFRMEIVNNTNYNLYVTVADLQPDGRLSAMFPYPDANGVVIQQVNYVTAHTTRKIDPVKEMYFTVAEPFGMDMYKVFATQDDINFTPLLDPPDDDESGTGKGAETKKRDIHDMVSRSGKGAASTVINLLANASLGIRAARPQVNGTNKNWFITSYTVQTLRGESKGGIAFSE